MIYLNEENPEEVEVDDEDATLPDDVLDEVAGVNEDDADSDSEGFGHVDGKEEEEEEESDYNDDGVPLEDDAEEVDFDTFDDRDYR